LLVGVDIPVSAQVLSVHTAAVADAAVHFSPVDEFFKFPQKLIESAPGAVYAQVVEAV